MTDMQEQAFGLMRALGASVGANLEPDANGACGLRVDDRLDVTLRYEAQHAALLVYAQVADLPDEGVDALTRHLLEANYLWEETLGATWSLRDDEIFLMRLLPLADTELPQLESELSSFFDLARKEQDALAKAPAAPEFDRPPPGMLTA